MPKITDLFCYISYEDGNGDERVVQFWAEHVAKDETAVPTRDVQAIMQGHADRLGREVKLCRFALAEELATLKPTPALTPDDIKLVLTCSGCPEQYEAYFEGKQVGYLRLRHGHFRVDFPNSGGKTVYTARPEGDGEFMPDERDRYISDAKAAIIRELNKTRH